MPESEPLKDGRYERGEARMLAHEFDLWVAEKSPVSPQELMDILKNILLRLRQILTIRDLTFVVRNYLLHNESLISQHGNALLKGPSGEMMPLLTMEERIADPDKAAMHDDLVALEFGDDSALEIPEDLLDTGSGASDTP